MIFISFKYSGIRNSFNGNEDIQFRGYGDIVRRNKITKIENHDELYLDNDYVTSSDSDQ